MPRKDGFRSKQSSSDGGGGGVCEEPAAAKGYDPRRCTGLSDARSRAQVGSAPGARLLSSDWNSNLPPPPWAGLPGLPLLEAEAPSGRPSTFLRGLGIAAGPGPQEPAGLRSGFPALQPLPLPHCYPRGAGTGARERTTVTPGGDGDVEEAGLSILRERRGEGVMGDTGERCDGVEI